MYWILGFFIFELLNGRFRIEVEVAGQVLIVLGTLVGVGALEDELGFVGCPGWGGCEVKQGSFGRFARFGGDCASSV